ncbi:hypothetical protein ACFWIJ_33535, partial [Streptomyces sp. NPDC127079]|uniref:hypothetical protein n=1 Tax=Streptomyces sp. NPDC127079 TaxID=3347132 RepID=UPI00364E8641
MGAVHDSTTAAGRSSASGATTDARDEPVAVIGLACRLPGAADPPAGWGFVGGGGVALTETPPVRPPSPVWF